MDVLVLRLPQLSSNVDHHVWINLIELALEHAREDWLRVIQHNLSQDDMYFVLKHVRWYSFQHLQGAHAFFQTLLDRCARAQAKIRWAAHNAPLRATRIRIFYGPTPRHRKRKLAMLEHLTTQRLRRRFNSTALHTRLRKSTDAQESVINRVCELCLPAQLK